MIASLTGRVASVSTGTAVIETGGVGVLIHATPETLSHLHIGTDARVETALIVREDALTLYGFGSEDERDVFEILHSVSGVGPRTALAILSVHSPDALRTAIERKDEAALTRVPGIGKKGAQRMLLELGSKLGPVRGSDSPVLPVAAGASEVLEALINLGWPEREAASALDEAMESLGEAGVAQLLRGALQILGARR